MCLRIRPFLPGLLGKTAPPNQCLIIDDLKQEFRSSAKRLGSISGQESLSAQEHCKSSDSGGHASPNTLGLDSPELGEMPRYSITQDQSPKSIVASSWSRVPIALQFATLLAIGKNDPRWILILSRKAGDAMRYSTKYRDLRDRILARMRHRDMC